MDIWKPNAFCTNETLFLSWDLCTVEGILVSMMPHGVLTFWRMPILRPVAKQSIGLSNDISPFPCNMIDILQVYFYTSSIPF